MTTFVDRSGPEPELVCRDCAKPVRRVFVGSIEAYGHVVNPGPNHHPVRVSTPKPALGPASPPMGAVPGSPAGMSSADFAAVTSRRRTGAAAK